MSSSPNGRPRLAIVLAAGKGTRMKSALAKPLHPVGGRPMMHWVLEAARGARCERIFVVVSADSDAMRLSLPAAEWPEVRWVIQRRQRGTGDAVAQAEEAVGEYLAESGLPEAILLVLSGDVPLLTAGTLETLAGALEADAEAPTWGSMAVAKLEEPGSLGRVLARPDGSLERIAEAADASPEELAVRRINAGIYALPAPSLFTYLNALDTDNAQGELYLTDALGAAADGHRLELVDLEDPSETWGINSRRELAKVHRRMLERHCEHLLDEGVTILDPARTTVEPTVRIGRDTTLHPGVCLLGDTEIGESCVLHQGAWLRDAHLDSRVTIDAYSVLEGARVAAGCRVGPFARLRPGAVLENGAKVGNFVEVKNSHLEPGVKAGHLAYLGDARIGAGTNIGAGVITCNYDGEKKHRTEVGPGAFIGSDTMLVAPVSIGEGATTAAGSTITQDVEAGELAVSRARQRNIPGWADRKRKRAARESGD